MIPHRQASRKGVEDGTSKCRDTRTAKTDRCREHAQLVCAARRLQVLCLLGRNQTNVKAAQSPLPLQSRKGGPPPFKRATNGTVPLLTPHLSLLTGTCYFFPGSNPLTLFGQDGRRTPVTQHSGTDGY